MKLKLYNKATTLQNKKDNKVFLINESYGFGVHNVEKVK